MASYFVALPLVELNFLASRYFCPNSFCAGFFMTSSFVIYPHYIWPGPMRGGSSRYIVPGPESQGGAHDSS